MFLWCLSKYFLVFLFSSLYPLPLISTSIHTPHQSDICSKRQNFLGAVNMFSRLGFNFINLFFSTRNFQVNFNYQIKTLHAHKRWPGLNRNLPLSKIAIIGDSNRTFHFTDVMYILLVISVIQNYKINLYSRDYLIDWIKIIYIDVCIWPTSVNRWIILLIF